jgi:hypothetical protein
MSCDFQNTENEKPTSLRFLTCSLSFRNDIILYGYEFLRINKRLVIAVNKLRPNIPVLSTAALQEQTASASSSPR